MVYLEWFFFYPFIYIKHIKNKSRHADNIPLFANQSYLRPIILHTVLAMLSLNVLTHMLPHVVLTLTSTDPVYPSGPPRTRIPCAVFK